MRIIALLFPVLLLFGCKSTQETAERPAENLSKSATMNYAPNALVLSISTTPCFGQCPVYELTVYGNQSVQFNGKRFAHKEGAFIGTLNKEQFTALLELMEEAQLTDAEAVYDNPDITDLPMTTILFTTPEGKQSIKARYDVPENIKSFISKVYDFSKNIRWEENTTTIDEE